MTQFYKPEGDTLTRLEGVIARLRKSGRVNEELYICDSFTGKVIHYEVGDENEVAINDISSLAANVVIHSHPEGADPNLSVADVHMALDGIAWMMVAVTGNTVSMMKIATDLPYDIRERMIAEVLYIGELFETSDYQTFCKALGITSHKEVWFKWASLWNKYIEYAVS